MKTWTIFTALVCLVGFESNKAAMAKLCVYTMSAVDRGEDQDDLVKCVNCFESVQNGSLAMKLDCGHQYHVGCLIDQASGGLHTCSQCRERMGNKLVMAFDRRRMLADRYVAEQAEIAGLRVQLRNATIRAQARAIVLDAVQGKMRAMKRKVVSTGMKGFFSGVIITCLVAFWLGGDSNK